MPTTIGSNVLMADRSSSILLGRAVTNHYLDTTTQASLTTVTPSLSTNPSSSAELTIDENTILQSVDDGTIIVQTPLLVGLEHSSALIHALLASFSVILVSELGDKTFIITAIMAMKNSRSLVFMSSAFALFLMTVLSVGMGVAVTVIPELYTHYASIVLFLCFGLKMLKEAYDMGADAESGESEFEEVKRSLEEEEMDVREKVRPEQQISSKAAHALQSEEPTQELTQEPMKDATSNITGKNPTTVEVKTKPNHWEKLVQTLYVAPIVIKVFTMIFVAEWGDRSQISTVILAAREDVVGVFIGSFSGHVLCTGLAVIGGRVVAEIISIRTLTFLGGIIFLFFAIFAIVVGPE